MDQGDDPYKLLGVDRTATEAEVKKAYRKLALEHHPDRQNDENERAKAQHVFAQIAGAYEVLMDPARRREYDDSQKEQKRSTGKYQGFDQNNTDIQFDDPYEVFKRNFKDEFGFEYPGAKFDFAEVPQHRRLKNKAKDQKLLTNGEVGDDSKKKKGNTKMNLSNDQPYDDSESKRNSGIMTLFRGNKDRQMAKSREQSNQLATRNRANEPNNRPTSMETSTKKIHHDDGTVETVTETKITRPDGSTETLRTSDKADKRPGWQGKNKNLLTNGSSPRGLLTNGNQPKGRLTNGNKFPLLTNGKNTRQSTSNANSKPVYSKNGVLVPFEQPKEQPRSNRRGLLGWGKGK